MKKRIAFFMAVLVLGVGINFIFTDIFLLDNTGVGFYGNKGNLIKITYAHIENGASGPETTDGAGEKHKHKIDTTSLAGEITKIELPNPFGKDATIETIINGIMDWLFALSSILASAMIVIGAYQILFAAGKEEQFRTGKRTIIYAAIGFSVIFLSRALINVITALING